MKTLRLILLTVGLALGGCTKVEYNPETHLVKFESFGGRELESLSVIREQDGSVLIEINKYRSEGIGEIVEGAVRGAIEGIKP